MTPLESLVTTLRAAAEAADQRRLLVLTGRRDAGWDAVETVVDAASVDDGAVTAVTTREGRRFERLSPARSARLLGETRDVVVCDAHEGFTPNVLGRVVGAVDGGGLFVLLVPPLDEWATARVDTDERLAVPPFDADDVGTRFRARLVETLRTHPGVAVVDVDAGVVERDGAYDSPLGGRSTATSVPADHAFPRAAYDACLTADQARAVAALESLLDPTSQGSAVVVEADRGRGKSSAAGLAAACLVAAGRRVLVTAPRYRNAREVFIRAAALLETLGYAVEHDESDHVVTARAGDADGESVPGQVVFRRPPAATEHVEAGEADVVIVDEAAALPVRVLEGFLDAPVVAFCTTVHGYEGAGRGFSVRFRERLAATDHDVHDVRLADPIRHASGDPVESWAFRALLLDARPPVDGVVEDATSETVSYEALSTETLLDDEHLLREVFGLLVLAHYRTEPDDLQRLLDAPNLSVRALCHRGHVVSVALLAREGGLDAATRRRMYEGERVRGNMLPDVLTSQLRDETAARPVGSRVMRIATHHAVRSRGLGSRLLAEIREELADERDWLGVGFGATPELLRFWRANGYRSVYLSTSRNETSGEHSAVMLAPLSPAGEALAARHTQWFVDRAAATLADSLSDVEADVVREALRAAGATPELSLSERDWRLVVDASTGPGLYSADPRPFRRLAVRALVDAGTDSGTGGADSDDLDVDTEAADTDDAPTLTARQERLLVRKVLQAHPWAAVADELGYVSTGQCMKALGAAYESVVDAYGTEAARRHRRRYEREE